MFKNSFKYYKSKNPPPNLEKVIDFNDTESLLLKSKIKKLNSTITDTNNQFGLKPPSTWEIYEVIERPGLIFIRNPFNSIGQRYWCVRCLQDYSKKPNKSNLDSLNLVSESKDWWDVCQNNSDVLLVKKLRWVTLGYHHNWDTKVYTDDNKGEFPRDLKNMCSYVASVLNFTNFNAEAAIVNYYHMDSTLSGHTDHSEKNLEAPLFSFSFGQTAVFLLGGPTKEEEPSAIFLRSGDIVIMTKQSRMCYHGVPKILQMDSRFWEILEEDETVCNFGKEYEDVVNICKEIELWKPFGDYLSGSRININVRQVLNRGQKRLNSESSDIT